MNQNAEAELLAIATERLGLEGEALSEELGYIVNDLGGGPEINQLGLSAQAAFILDCSTPLSPAEALDAVGIEATISLSV